jgi:hyperosmotically inducible periplasmic protein
MYAIPTVLAGLALSFSLAACSPAERDDVQESAERALSTTEAHVEDAAVTAAVKAKLLADQTVSGMMIDVDTSNGVVTLTGTVTSEAARATAIELARTTGGVTRVEDKLALSH